MNIVNKLPKTVIIGLLAISVVVSLIVIIYSNKYDAAGGPTACKYFDDNFDSAVDAKGTEIFVAARDAFVQQKDNLSKIADAAIDYARSRPAYVKLLNEWIAGNQTDEQANKIYAAYKAGIDEYFGLGEIKTKIDVILDVPRSVAKSQTSSFSYPALKGYCGEGSFSSLESGLKYNTNWSLVKDRSIGAKFTASIDVTTLVTGSNDAYYDTINSTFGTFATKLSDLGRWFNERLTFKNGDRIILRANISIKGVKEFGASYVMKFNL